MSGNDKIDLYKEEIDTTFRLLARKNIADSVKTEAIDFLKNMLFVCLKTLKRITQNTTKLKLNIIEYNKYFTNFQLRYADLHKYLKFTSDEFDLNRLEIYNIGKIIYTLMDDKLEHPIHKGYFGYKNGDMFSSASNKLLISKSNEEGYIISVITGSKAIKRHRFIKECFMQVDLNRKYEIDHIDNVSANNSLFNLQMLSSQEHHFKTRKTTKSHAPKQIKTIVRFKMNSKHEKCEITEFAGSYEAAVASSCSQPAIIYALKKQIKTTQGYYFEHKLKKEDSVIKNEIWKNLGGITTIPKNCATEISNMGRVKSYSGIISYGNVRKSGYYEASILGKSYKVHQLVMLAFKGLPPEGYNYTVDHIDRKKGNNQLSNLRWATAQEQAENATAISVNLYEHEKFIKTFSSIKKAAEFTGVEVHSISKHLKKGTVTLKGFSFKKS